MRAPRKTGQGKWLHLEMWRPQQEKNGVDMNRGRPIRQQSKKGAAELGKQCQGLVTHIQQS